MESLGKRAKRHLKPTLYFHNSIAMAFNVFAVLTAPPFKLLPRWHFVVYFLISVFVTYRFLYNYKAYSVNEFEDLYHHLPLRDLPRSPVRVQDAAPHLGLPGLPGETTAA